MTTANVHEHSTRIAISIQYPRSTAARAAVEHELPIATPGVGGLDPLLVANMRRS